MNRPDNSPRPTPRAAASGTPSIIGDNVTIEGNLISNSEIQLDGTVKGDVTCSSLTMGESGSCNGLITADSVVIRGRVDGSIKARSVRLEQSARVNGDVLHESLAVEAGAVLSGTFTHSDNPLGKPAKPVASAESKPANDKPAGAKLAATEQTNIERVANRAKADAAE